MSKDFAVHSVRQFFETTAIRFDSLYEREGIQRTLRPSLVARRDLALAVAERLSAPNVLDVGCGSARLGESMLEAGVKSYIGVDFSAPMLELARPRLERFGCRAQLVKGDLAVTDLKRTFDMIIALGFFEYVPDPYQIFSAICKHSHIGSILVASFITWDWFRGPYRWFKYCVVNNCPIRNYTLSEIEVLLSHYGFECLSVERITHCYLVVGRKAR